MRFLLAVDWCSVVVTFLALMVLFVVLAPAVMVLFIAPP
jgi:hypothetical protein